MHCIPHRGAVGDELGALVRILLERKRVQDGARRKDASALPAPDAVIGDGVARGQADSDDGHGALGKTALVVREVRKKRKVKVDRLVAQRTARDGAVDAVVARYAESRPPGDLVVPQHWDFNEACRYWNEVIVPSTDPGQLIVPIERVYYTPCPSNAHTVIVKALAFRIRAVVRHQDAEGLPYAALDSRSLQDSFHRYMGFMIKTVNAGLAEAPKRPVPGVFVKIHALLAIELYILSGCARAHIDGFIALLQLRGGTRKVIQSGEATISAVSTIMLFANIINTTSPCSNQILTASYFSMEDIKYLYGDYVFHRLLCPTQLFLDIVATTRLRVYVAGDDAVDTLIQSAANAILAHINAFALDDWNEPDTFPDENTEPVYLLARIFKPAVALYAMVSLPVDLSHYSSEVTKLHPIAGRSPIQVYAEYIIQLIRAEWQSFISRAVVVWPLAVVGAAVVEQADRDFVACCLYDIGQEPNADAVPMNLRAVLLRFWESGKTSWDDCFCEPVISTC